MTEPKNKQKRKKPTRAVHKTMSIEVAVSLSPEAENLLTHIGAMLDGIAQEIRRSNEISELRLFDAVAYTKLAKEAFYETKDEPPTVEIDNIASMKAGYPVHEGFEPPTDRRGYMDEEPPTVPGPCPCDRCIHKGHMENCNECVADKTGWPNQETVEDVVDEPRTRMGHCENCGATTEVVEGVEWAVCGECHHPNPEGPAPR